MSNPNPTQEQLPPTRKHRIAVYGSLRKGEYNHSRGFANGATHVIDGHIEGAELVGGNAYPWVVPGNGRVLVEVYDIDDTTFEWIEAMERGAGYERRPVYVISSAFGGAGYDAEAYFYKHPDYIKNNPRIASGDWTKRDAETASKE